MPLPAAFREAAEALRILILTHTQQQADGTDLLSQLYVVGAQESFLLGPPSVLGEGSSYSVAATIPKDVWLRLPMPYTAIGYRHLPLLTQTDLDWFVVAWGEPNAHVSAREYHQAVWDDYATRAGRERWIGNRPRRPARR
jgi:hypothetical protein